MRVHWVRQIEKTGTAEFARDNAINYSGVCYNGVRW